MKAALASVAVIVAALALFEVTMRPTAPERLQLLLIFGAMAVVTVLIGSFLPRWAVRLRSLRSRVLVVVAAALGVVVVASITTAELMFVTVHDLNLLVIVLGYGIALGTVLAATLTQPLTSDLHRIAVAASRVAEGDLTARTGVERPDELGVAARAFDQMIGQLAAAEQSRREFLAAVGHDLRTPLAALRAALEALEDDLAPDPERYLRAMRADVDALSHLVEDVFLLATIEAGRLEVEHLPVDLAELADESIEALEPVAARRGIGLKLETEGRVTIVGGPQALGRAIRNLIDNAIRFAPAGSDVIVRVRNVDGAVVSVADEGPGFAPELVDSAFEGFVTGDEARSRQSGGAGLGLAISRGVVAAHGGAIWAEPGPGGTVTFRLPVTS